MKFKGTKGKWERYGEIVLTDDGAYRPNAMQKTISSNEKLQANAQLISCAPEMLETLKSLVNIFQRGEMKDAGTVGGSKLKQASELIKKATEL